MSRETSRGKATVCQVCEVFHITRQAYYAARRPKKDRVAPTPTTKSSSGTPRWVPAEELKAAIQEVVAEHKGWGVRKVWAFLRRQGTRVSQRRVWALMSAMGLTFDASTQRANYTHGHVAVPESNRRWGTDLTTVWTRQDGVVAVLPVIDCGDRFVFEIGVSKSQESRDVLLPLESALEGVFGTSSNLPALFELRTDHGPQYTGSDCDGLCDAWGIDHTFAPVGRPTGNAVTERFIQTLKVELIWTRDWDSLQELRDAIQAWLAVYNYQRPHQALNWLTPAEKRAENLTTAHATPQLRLVA